MKIIELVLFFWTCVILNFFSISFSASMENPIEVMAVEYEEGEYEEYSYEDAELYEDLWEEDLFLGIE